ncbi:MAG: FAD:protein FMN transferase [Paracoccaceae bacterium]
MNRRRFLTIAAASLACPAHATTPQIWQGQALGAAGKITLTGTTPTHARHLFRKIERTLTQIDAQFSLYRDSALTRLNRDGHLSHPAPEILALCQLASQIHTATNGAFDPSIQPLWLATATNGDIANARRQIGWSRVQITKTAISLAPGMALTFNGIAQGHAADQIAALLRAEGLTDTLIDMGEINALGTNNGTPWRAAIALPTGEIIAQTSLTNRALATSSPRGTLIGQNQPHILHPNGTAAPWQLASVSAPSAALADALSTAFCLMDRAAIAKTLAAFPQTRLQALA